MNTLKYKHFSPLSCKCSDGHWAGLVEVLWDKFSEICFTLLLFMLNIVVEMPFFVLSTISLVNMGLPEQKDGCYYAEYNYQNEKYLSHKTDHMLDDKVNQKCAHAKNTSVCICVGMHLHTYIYMVHIWFCKYIYIHNTYILKSTYRYWNPLRSQQSIWILVLSASSPSSTHKFNKI